MDPYLLDLIALLILMVLPLVLMETKGCMVVPLKALDMGPMAPMALMALTRDILVDMVVSPLVM